MLKPYDEYKKIDLLWLDMLPSHWQCMRNKNILTEVNVRSRDGSEELLRISQYTGVTIRRHNKSKAGMRDAETLEGYKIVKKNDIVMNIMLAWNGSTGTSAFDGIVSPAYSVFRIKQDVNPWYIHYLFRIPAVTNYFKAYSTGVVESRLRLYSEELFMLTSIIPPREEQNQIVRFLDRKLAKINKLIRAKKKQIALLDEQRRATIDKAIMYGNRIQVSRKESGIIWLGKIPSQWSVMKLKWVCQINASISSQLKEHSLEEFIIFLPMGNISSDGGIDCSEKRKLKDVKNGFSSFAKNDVVVAKITPCFENGKGACLDTLETDIGFGTTELIVLRANEKVLPRYLYMITQLQQFRIQGAEVMTGSAGQKRVPSDFVANFTLGIPSMAEQYEILNHLDNCLAKIDRIKMTVNDEIKLLYEHRTRLISDVATGKVDVRDIEIPEYEADSDEATDDEIGDNLALEEENGEMEVE